MTKGIFVFDQVDRGKIKAIRQLGFDTIFISDRNLNNSRLDALRKNDWRIFVETGVFNDNLCPNDQLVRRNKLEKIKRIMQEFAIDGLWLDFIRFPAKWEAENQQLTDIHRCSRCQSLEDRTRVISRFVSRVRALIDKGKRKIQLGMFTVPLKKNELNGTITRTLGQDFKSLAEHVDVFSPMVYHKMCGKTTKWIHGVVKYMDRVTNRSILPIIQTEDKPSKISGQEFKTAIDQAMKFPSRGVIIFFLEDLLKSKQKLSTMKSFFK